MGSGQRWGRHSAGGSTAASSTGSTAARRMKQQIPGSGLGLSIALGIARAHGGDLTSRAAPGETVFRLFLPRTPREIAIEQDASWWSMTSRASVASCERR